MRSKCTLFNSEINWFLIQGISLFGMPAHFIFIYMEGDIDLPILLLYTIQKHLQLAF